MAHAVEVIQARDSAALALHPLRLRILEHLREADSAAGVARAFELPRQRVTYHVRELERAGLLESVGERKKGNCIERLVRSTARSYLIAPQALGDLGALGDVRDRFSSSYVLALAAQTIRDVGELRELSDQAGKTLPTLSLQTEVRFGSASAQNGFAEELSQAVAHLVSKYHDETAPSGRTFRMNLMAYPRPAREADRPSNPVQETES